MTKKRPAQTQNKPTLSQKARQGTRPTKTEIKQMEVHHHPEVEKKGFKEYLLEGLMIFLAVFMGFIAENIREDYTEHQKASAYAATMVNDLQTDQDSLKSFIKYYSFANRNVGTLMSLISKNDIGHIPTGKLYIYGLFGGALRSFVPNDATFQQMQSTGALEYFPKNIAREAEQYHVLCQQMALAQENDHGVFVEVRRLHAQIFLFQYNIQVNDIVQAAFVNNYNIDTAKLNSFIKTKPPLLTYDPAIFNQYVELVRSRFMDRTVKLADRTLACANNLTDDIKKEYHTDK